MKIVVVGTSNSILRGGYADALRQTPEVTAFLRIGPGGSTSVILPYFGMDVDFAAFDFVVIDTSVNDGAFLGWGLLTEEDIRGNVEWLCRRARQQGCRPILLIMPNRTKLDGSDRAATIYREMAVLCGADVLDGYRFVARLQAQDGAAGPELFMDDMHLRADVAVRLVPELLVLCRRPRAPAPLHGTGAEYRRIEAPDLATVGLERCTSLLRVSCAPLAANERIGVRLEPDEELCGVVFNAAHSTGSLFFEGVSHAHVNVRSAYFGKHELVVLARQISPAVGPKEGRVEVLAYQPDGQAELIGLLVRQPPPSH